METVKCKYDPLSPAEDTCVDCTDGLCSFCGYTSPQTSARYCNECWAEKEPNP